MPNRNLKPDSSFGTDQHSRFIEAARSIAAMAQIEQFEIVPFYDPSLPHFSALTEAGRTHALWRLETLESICERLQRRGQSICKSRALIWAFFGHMKLRPPQELNEIAGDEFEVIDVYNDAHQLIFANLSFFRVVSYSLEDLYCRPWMSLFKRDNYEIENELLKYARAFSRNELREVVILDHMTPHIVHEADSVGMVTAMVTSKVIAPVFGSSKRVEAYMAIHQVKRISGSSSPLGLPH